LAVLALIGLVSAIGGLYLSIVSDLPSIESLRDYRPNLPTRILAANGDVVKVLAEEERIVIPLEQVPQHVLDAFISAEDKEFRSHHGLDFYGIGRAAWGNLVAGEVTGGGSTITQQVAKTFLLSSEQTVVRKIKDMLLARQIEQRLTKDEILYLYLNQIYLGSRAYGIEQAARTYFGKPASELDLAEGSLIAGLVPAPSRYSPFKSLRAAKVRQNYVLERMMQDGKISPEERKAAYEAELRFVGQPVPEVTLASRHFAEEVRRYLVDHYGEEAVKTGGMTIRTTIDPTDQVAAYRAVRKGLREHDKRMGYRGPLANHAQAEWPGVIEDLGKNNPVQKASPGRREVVKALVTSVDDQTQKIALALGPGAQTELGLEDVAWARKPDATKDGVNRYVRKVSETLKPGDLVQLEKEWYRAEDGSAKPRWVLFQRPLAEGALLSLDVETGHVKAMLGGYEWGSPSQFNRAVQMKRQPGSAFKPIIYASAMQLGYTPATIVYDTPMVYEDDLGNVWKPGNYGDKFYGPITLREALSRSRNIATIKVLRDIGIPSVLETAASLGIRGRLVPDLSLALGSSEVTLVELLQAYSTFAANGKIVKPIFILEIRDRNDQLLEENVRLAERVEETEGAEEEEEEAGAFSASAKQAKPPELDETEVMGEIRTEVDRADDPLALPEGYGLDPVTSYLMTHMLRAVVEEGTGARARTLERPVVGKTGTTNDQHDAWFIGFSPATVTGVWVGYDQARPLGVNETGSRAATPIWVDYMKTATREEPVRNFEIPDGVVFARIDRKTGLLAKPEVEDAIFMPFREGTVPTEFAPVSNENGNGNGAPVRERPLRD
jgi:penicillin-binding protein 1A